VIEDFEKTYSPDRRHENNDQPKNGVLEIKPRLSIEGVESSAAIELKEFKFVPEKEEEKKDEGGEEKLSEALTKI